MLNNLRIGAKLAGMQTAMLALLIAVGASGLYGMGQIKEGLRTVYEDRTVCLVQLSHILDDIHRIRANILLMAATSPAAAQTVIPRALERIALADKDREKQWSDYVSTYLTPDEKKLADTFVEKYEGYAKKRAAILAAVTSGERGERVDALLADATAEIARNVHEAANGTREVSSNIRGVVHAAEETGAGARETLAAANDLSRASESLTGEVERFIGTIRRG